MVDGLLYGVPQIVVPGKIFERKYNAKCVADHKAGIVLDHREFTTEQLQKAANEILSSDEMAKNAALLGRKLLEAGGMDTIIRSVVSV